MSKNTGNADDHEFEIVNESELNFARRGRKSSSDPAIVAMIAKLTPGQVIVVKKLRVDLTDKSRKATVSAQLRSAGKQAGVVVDIKFTVDGFPTVRLRSRSRKWPSSDC